jgi:hypothetical protein
MCRNYDSVAQQQRPQTGASKDVLVLVLLYALRFLTGDSTPTVGPNQLALTEFPLLYTEVPCSSALHSR